MEDLHVSASMQPSDEAEEGVVIEEVATANEGEQSCAAASAEDLPEKPLIEHEQGLVTAEVEAANQAEQGSTAAVDEPYKGCAAVEGKHFFMQPSMEVEQGAGSLDAEATNQVEQDDTTPGDNAQEGCAAREEGHLPMQPLISTETSAAIVEAGATCCSEQDSTTAGDEGQDRCVAGETNHLLGAFGAEDVIAAVLANSSDDESGLRVYAAILHALLKELGMYGPDGLLQPSRQLEIYLHAAKVFEFRNDILGFLRDETTPTTLPITYKNAVVLVQHTLKKIGKWHLLESLKSKRIFGHEHAIRSIQLPGLPSNARNACVYVKKAGESRIWFQDLFKFRATDNALTSLVDEGLALVLNIDLDNKEQPSFFVISPIFARQGIPDDVICAHHLKEELITFVAGEKEAWKNFVKGTPDVISKPSLKLIKAVLKGHAHQAQEACAMEVDDKAIHAKRPIDDVSKEDPEQRASTAEFATPIKTAKTSEAKMRESTTPDESPDQAEGIPSRAEDELGQRIYARLLSILFHVLGLDTDDRIYLEAKKQLLVYHHAAKLHELRETVVGAMKGDEACTSALPEAYQRAVSKVRKHLTAEGTWPKPEALKTKRIFGHEHAIRFHQPPNVPQNAKGICVFLRERPHASSDGSLKRSSWFRDVIRFRCAGNPLSSCVEEPGLGLVINVDTVFPRAFLVISPLLLQPDVVSECAGLSWGQLQEALKDHLTQAIAAESDAWRSFLQRHANIVAKDSLYIIQKVLKSCKPSLQYLSETGDIEECKRQLEEAHEQIREVEEKCKLEAQEQFDAKCGETELLIENNSELLLEINKTKERSKYRTSVLKSKLKQKEQKLQKLKQNARILEKSSANDQEKSFEAREERDAAVEKLKASEEANAALVAQLASKTEQASMAQNELEGIMTQQDEVTRRVDEAEQAAKKSKDESDRLKAKAKQEIKEAKEQKAAAERSVEASKSAENQVRGELQLKEGNLQALKTRNERLLLEMAESMEKVAKADEQVTIANKKAHEATSELELKVLELSTEIAAKTAEVESFGGLQAELAKAQEDASEAVKRVDAAEHSASQSRQAELCARATLKTKVDEIMHLTASCETLTLQAAKASEALKDAEERSTELKKTENRLLAEVELKSQSVEHLTTSNTSLRAEVSQAREDERKASEIAAAAQRTSSEAVSEARSAESKAYATLKEKSDELCTVIALQDASKVEIATLKAHVVEADERVSEAENKAAQAVHNASQSHQAELCARAESQAKVEEIARLIASCTSMTKQVAELREQRDQANERVASAELVSAEAHRALIKAQAELHLKSEAVEHLTTSNTFLRAEASQAREDASKASEIVAAAQRASSEEVSEARSAESKAHALLKETSDELCTLIALQDASKVEIAALKAHVVEADERVSEAEHKAAQAVHNASQSHQAELCAQAESQAKAKEVARLIDSCTSLTTQMVNLQEQVDRANERVASAELVAAEATRAEIKSRAELQLRAEAASRLTASNVELRAHIAKARDEESKAAATAAASEQMAKQAREAQTQAEALYEDKAKEIASVEASCNSLQVRINGMQEDLVEADKRAAWAEQASAASRRAEIQACAEEQARKAEAKQLAHACAALRAELVKARKEAAAAIDLAKARRVERLGLQEIGPEGLEASPMIPAQDSLAQTTEGCLPKEECDIVLSDLERALDATDETPTSPVGQLLDKYCSPEEPTAKQAKDLQVSNAKRGKAKAKAKAQAGGVRRRLKLKKILVKDMKTHAKSKAKARPRRASVKAKSSSNTRRLALQKRYLEQPHAKDCSLPGPPQLRRRLLTKCSAQESLSLAGA